MPVLTFALEPEQQVGSTVTATGLSLYQRPCSNAIDRLRPLGRNLGSKGNQVSIEHRRKHHIYYLSISSEVQIYYLSISSEVQLLCSTQR